MSSYIEVKNVSKSFSGRAILQNISLPVEQGTTVGLVGANGSGKSVLFKIICGFEKPDQGSVYVRGNQLGKNGCDFPESLGVFINSPGFIGIYNGFQNLKFLADIQGKIGEKEIRQAMSKVGLDPDNKTKVDNYSLGMKQKLGLAQAIMEGQDTLILDEPFNALDYKTYEDVKAIIRMLKAEGKTIFLTSHHYKDRGSGRGFTSGVCSCLCRWEEHQIGRVFLPGPVVMRDKANRRNVNTHYKPATPRKNGVIC